MWNPLENWRQRRARQRYMPQARTVRTGRTAQAAVLLLVLILLVSALLELRGDDSAAALAAAVEERGEEPLDLVARASRTHRLVFLADIAGSGATKRFAAEAIERIANESQLDVVALPIDAEEQRFIDAYLHAAEEDVSLLITRPRLLHEADGVAGAYLEIFRTVRRLNEALGADRQIRILALNPPDWPPARAAAPHELARRFGERDEHMHATIGALLSREPRTRVLFLVDGLQALRGSGGSVQTGGTRTVQTTWLASRLERDYPQDVYSILVDASASRTSAPHVAAYRGTAAGPLLAEHRTAAIAIPIDEAFDFTRQPVRVAGRPGIRFELEPHGVTLTQLADAYLFLGE